MAGRLRNGAALWVGAGVEKHSFLVGENLLHRFAVTSAAATRISFDGLLTRSGIWRSASLNATSAGVKFGESLLAKTASLSAASVRIFTFLADLQL